MLGLVVRTPWVEKIVAGEKTWEIRGSAMKVRGRIALIRGGSGLVVGTCRLVGCVGPLTSKEMEVNADRHRIPSERLAGTVPYERTFAWVIEEANPLPEPLPYNHPSGAVIWVRLSEQNMGPQYNCLDR